MCHISDTRQIIEDAITSLKESLETLQKADGEDIDHPLSENAYTLQELASDIAEKTALVKLPDPKKAAAKKVSKPAKKVAKKTAKKTTKKVGGRR